MVSAVPESSGKVYPSIDSKGPYLDIQIQFLWTRAREPVFFTQLPGVMAVRVRRKEF